MTEEYIPAISFANNYFTLIDSGAYYLENHLAETVSLDWFGKIVTGKHNVAAFMRINMTNSRHIFHEIRPAQNILSQKRPRKKQGSETNSEKSEHINDENGLNLSKLHLHDNFKSSIIPEIKAAHDLEKIAIISMKEEKNESMQKMDCEISGKLVTTESLKFIRANGIVQIHRLKGPNKIRKWESAAFVSDLPGHTCRRKCILQVAYSSPLDQTMNSEIDRSKRNTEGMIERGEKIDIREMEKSRRRKRLSSNEEEMSIDEKIIAIEDSFNPYEGFYTFHDRQNLLKYYETEMNGRRKQFHFSSPEYIDGRLVLDLKRKNSTTSNESGTGMKFDYLIHSIVYERNRDDDGISNLTEEVGDRKSLSDSEKSV